MNAVLSHRPAAADLALATAVLLAALFGGAAARAGGAAAAGPAMDPASCPLHAQHMAAAKAALAPAAAPAHDPAAHAAMDARGSEGMGFSQTATTHHFVITASGGEIRVEANDAADTASRDQIRTHLAGIARAFAAGDFAIPMFVHDQTPPGVPTLARLRAEVRYLYADLPQGGRVEITTANPEALAAVHEFLRFQIAEHRTGDPLP